MRHIFSLPAGWRLLVVGLLATGCRGFLDRDPIDEVSREDALKTLPRAEAALAGAYAQLSVVECYGRFMMVYPELTGGNVTIDPTSNVADLPALYNFNADPDETFTNVYSEYYRVVHQANDLIEAALRLTDGTAQGRNYLLGEAAALRALAHFDLLRIYAQPYAFTPDATHPGVALITRPPAVFDTPARDPVGRVYGQIAADLEQAVLLLDGYAGRSGQPASWLNAWAVRGLLARVYLYQGQWSRAVTFATEAIDGCGLTLLPTATYADSWRAGTTHPETLFQIDMGHVRAPRYALYWGGGAPAPVAGAAADLTRLYDSTDVRGAAPLLSHPLARDLRHGGFSGRRCQAFGYST